MSVRSRLAALLAAVALTALTLSWASIALADAGNPILGSINASATSTATTVTIYVRGEWNWLSHNSDCNFDRAATGVGIAWQDLNGAGTTRGNNEKQTITIVGSPTGGTFKLKFGGQTTTAIAYNATAAQVDAALEALSSIGAGNVVVTGAAGGPYTVEFTGSLAGTNVGAISLASKSFTGGSGTNVTFATSPQGSAPIYNGYLVSNGAIQAYIGYQNATAVGGAQDRMVHPVDLGNVPEGFINPVPAPYTTAGYPATQVFVNPTPANPASYLQWKGGCGREPLSGTLAGQFAGDPWGSWGYQPDPATNGGVGWSHTYLKTLPDGTSGLPDRVCVNFYDVHGGGAAGTSSFQLVKGASEITVDGNGDNSIDTNAFNVNNGANCISIANPAIVTHATAGITIGSTASDSADLTGTKTGAGGTIVFNAYAPNDPTCTGTAEFTSSAFAVNGNGTYGPATFTPTKVGDYHWIATYSGDLNTLTLGVAGTCGDTGETTSVGKAQPGITTTSLVSASLNSQSSVNIHDVAHVTQPANTINTTGAITFDVYGPGDTTCQTSLATLNATPATDGTGDYTSANYSATTPGTYLWIAHLAQDSNNKAANTGCGDANESTLVINPRIDVSKTPSNQSVPLGGTAHFTITVTNIGDARLFPVTVGDALSPGCARTTAQTDPLIKAVGNFDKYLDPGESFTYNCDSNPVTVAFVNVVTACGDDPIGGNVCDTDTNGGNPGGDCPASEADRCAGVTPSTLTSVQDFKPRDNGTLSGLVGSPGGTLTFKLYKGACTSGNLLDTLTATVTGNTSYQVTSASFLSDLLATAGLSADTAGTYNWQLTYSGDAASNNAGITGACGTEHFVVTNN